MYTPIKQNFVFSILRHTNIVSTKSLPNVGGMHNIRVCFDATENTNYLKASCQKKKTSVDESTVY